MLAARSEEFETKSRNARFAQQIPTLDNVCETYLHPYHSHYIRGDIVTCLHHRVKSLKNLKRVMFN